MTKPFIGDDVGQIAEIFGICSPLSDPDPCEAAVKIGMCIMGEGKKRNLPLEF